MTIKVYTLFVSDAARHSLATLNLFLTNQNVRNENHHGNPELYLLPQKIAA